LTDKLPAVSEESGAIQEVEATRKCPFCREVIFSDAIKCKHCGSALAPISENFSGLGQGQFGGNTVQIVTNTPEKKTSQQVVHPPLYHNPMLGHGCSGLIISVLVSISVASLSEDREAASGIAIIGSFAVVPWMVWVITRPSANKALPAIAIVLSVLTFGNALA
jgi:hypothetical protein